MDGISGAVRYIFRCKRDVGVGLAGDRRGGVDGAICVLSEK